MANESLVPESLTSPLLDEALSAAPAEVQPRRSNIFSYYDNDQLDRDFDGRKTEELGKQTGLPYTRDTVLELNVMGTVMAPEEILKYEGGAELMDLAKRKRAGRRTFVEALTTGTPTDFLPYVEDIASLGISIKNMKTVRDSMEKMRKEGINALTPQEKVLTKLYIEDMERQSNQTFGGLVGTIIRQAPAFAMEFLITGGLFKGATKLAGIAAKETVEEGVEKAMKKGMSELVYRELKKPGVVKESLSTASLNVERLADEVVASADVAGLMTAGEKASIKAKALKTAEAYVTAYKDPSKLRAAADFVTEYCKRGFFDHMDEVVRDLPPSVMGKLREAAGVALVEAPIKGALYGSFDFAVVNPIVARLAGGDEAVTRTELGIYSTGREELMRHAKMLALGSAIAEYASETSGRAFNALAGTVTQNLAGDVGRQLARRGLRAVATTKDKEAGSVVQKLLEATYGTDAELKAALSGAKSDVLKRAFEAGRLEGEGIKSLAEAQVRPDLVDKLMREKLRFQEKSFLGYWIANKSIEKGITPRAVTRLLESMGYDNILGEFMEERYSDFAQGLFGLDGSYESKKGIAGRLAYAAKQSVPTFKQGAAELLAFAVPVVGRAMISKAYGVLGASDIGKAAEAGRIISELESFNGFTFESASEPVRTADVKTADADASVLSERAQRWGRMNVKEGNEWMRSRVTELARLLEELAPKVSTLREGKTGIVTGIAKAALKTMEFMITGNPLVAFHDPLRAMIGEKAGQNGGILLSGMGTMYRELYRRKLAASTSSSVKAIEDRKDVESLPESEMNDPAIIAAIRPQLREGAEALAKMVLAASGNVITTEADVDKHLDTVFKDGVTELDGLSREAFKKKFIGELHETAAGRMSMMTDGGRTAFFYKRPSGEGTPVGELSRQVESFLNQHNIVSYIDAEGVGDIKASIRDTARTAMDSDIMETAADVGGTRDKEKVLAARFQIAMTAFSGVNMSNKGSFDRVIERAGEYAKAFVAVHGGLLRKQFESADGVINVSGIRGEYRLEYADEDGKPAGRRVPGTQTFKSLEEAYVEAAKHGEARSAQIAFTPSNAVFARYASMLLATPGASEYMRADPALRDRLMDNPFVKGLATGKSYRDILAEVTADIELARRYQDRVANPFATEAEEKAAKVVFDRTLGENGYETIAAKAAEAQKIRLAQKPDSSGVTGYMFTPAALNDNGVVLVPYRFLGVTTALVEDSVETAMKRMPWLFQDPTDPTKYRPSVQAFMRVVQNELNAFRENPENSEDLRSKANYLTNMFNPDVYNFEAISHAITAFPMARGDAAVIGEGLFGSQYYDVLGKIATRVRADRQEYNGFLSLCNRLTGGDILTADPASGARLSTIVAGVAPRSIVDDPNAVRTQVEGEVKYTIVGDVNRAGKELDFAIATANRGLPRSGLVSKDAKEAANEQARYAAEMKDVQSLALGGNVYLPEDLPYLLEDSVRGRNMQKEVLSSDVVAKAEKENPVTAAKELWRMVAAKNALDPNNEPSASMAEDSLIKRPAVAIMIAEEWMKSEPVLSGDRRSKLEQVFDTWMAHDPLLKPSVYYRFLESVEKAGLLKKDRKSVESGMLTRAALDELQDEMDPRMDTVEGNDDESSGEIQETLDTETEDNRPGGEYVEGKAAADLENSQHALIIRGMFHQFLPAAQRNDQTAIEMLVSYSAAKYENGMSDPNSYASLFNPAVWNQNCLHPALVDEAAFTAWLDQPRPEDGDPLFDNLKIALRALGRDSAFAGLDKLKGSYGKEILTATIDVGPTGEYAGIKIDSRRQSLSAEVSESLIRSAKMAGTSKVDEAIALLEKEKKAGPGGRTLRFAQAAELIFGKHNWLSQKFSDPKTRWVVTRHLRATPDKEHAKWHTWFKDYMGNGYGLFGLRLHNAANMLKAGKSAEDAVREVLRGDAYALKKGDDRGGMLVFLNAAAGLEPVTSASRKGRSGKKVRSVDQDLGTGQLRFLLSDQFKKAYVAMNGARGEQGLDHAQRFGLWPDGSKVFATMAGLTRRTRTEDTTYSEEVGLPTYEEIVDVMAQDYARGTGPMAYVALYNSEKTMERIVQIPRELLPVLTGKDKPTYEDTLKLLSKLHGITDVSPKRVAYYTAGGAAALVKNARVAVIVPAGDRSAGENYHGMGYIPNAALAEYYRLQGFDSASKVILTDDPASRNRVLFTKGQFIMVDKPAKAGAVSAAEVDIRKLSAENKLDYVADMDSFKETFLYYKSTDGKTVMDLMEAGVTEADIVTPDGMVKLSELVKETSAEVIPSVVNGAKVNLFTFTTGLRSQTVSAPPKKAVPKHNDVPVNYMSDNPQMWKSLRAQDAVRVALSEREAKVDAKRVIDSLPESVRTLLDHGCGLHSPVIARLVGPKLANAATSAYRQTMYGVQYLNRNFDGARVVEKEPGVPMLDENGKFVVSDPYGGMDPLCHDAQEFTPAQQEAFGVKRRLASTAANAGGATFRYGLRVNIGKGAADVAGTMQAVEGRVIQLKMAELSGNLSKYLETYKNLISGAFLDWKGDPLQDGQLLSFADLVDIDADGKPTFDRSRLTVKTINGETFVFLGGEIEISGRTPSRDGRRAEYAHSVARPAYMQEADGTQTYMGLVTRADGTVTAEEMFYPVGTLIPGTDAILVMTPVAKYLAGSDEDWDKSHSQRLPTDKYGREARKVADAANAIRNAATLDEARIIGKRAIEGLEAEAYRASVQVHRTYDPKLNPVTATPFTYLYETGNIPKIKRPGLDTVAGSGSIATSNKEVSQKLRGISVRIVGDCLTAYNVGMHFTAPVLRGRSVLDKPAGAKSSFWDRGGFTVGVNGLPNEARIQTFIDFSTGISNSTFDDLKVALASRAGFRAEYLDMYLFLGFESGVASQEEYENFHTAFMEWMNGPDGKAVSLGFRNKLYPKKYGGVEYTRKARTVEFMLNDKARKEAESDGPRVFRMFTDLSAPHKEIIKSLTIARGGTPEAYVGVSGLARALLFMQRMSAVGTIMTYKKADLAFVNQIENAENDILTVGRLLTDGEKTNVAFGGQGYIDVSESLNQFRDMVGSARKALSGDVRLSNLYKYVSKVSVGEKGWSGEARKAAGDRSQAEATEYAIGTLLPFEAALSLAPKETLDKLTQVIAANKGAAPTASVLTFIETAFMELYGKYAGSGRSNAAMDILLAPSRENGADRLTITGSDNIALSEGAVQAAMESMRDGTSGIPNAKVFVNPSTSIEVTPSDFYWMLMQYTLLTSGLAVDTTRGNQALLRAFYGPDVFRAVSDYQTAYVTEVNASGVGREDPLRLLNFVSVKGPDGRRAYALRGVPDGYALPFPESYTLPSPPRAAVKPDPRALPPERKPLETRKLVAQPERMVSIPDSYKGVAIVKAETQTHPVHGGKPAASLKIAADGTASIVVDEKEINRQFNAKQWAAPRLGGITALPKDAFKTPIEWAEFAIEHEYQHTLFPRVTKDAGLAAYSANEEAINRAAAKALGRTAELYPGSQVEEETLVAQTPASVAAYNLHLQAKALAIHEVVPELRRLSDYLIYGSEESKRMSDREAAAARVMSTVLDRVVDTAWGAGIPGAQDITRAASVILDAMRYPEPSVFMGAVRALYKAASMSGNRDAVGELDAILGEANAKSMKSMDRIASLRESSVAADAPLLRVMEYALASETRVDTGNSKAEVEATARKILEGLGIEIQESSPRDNLDRLVASQVQGISASMASEVQSDFNITDEELAVYAAQPGQYELSDDLQRKLAERLEALIPPMPDEFEDSNPVEGYSYRKRDGGWQRQAHDGGGSWEPIQESEATSAWVAMADISDMQKDSFALVAQAVEDWKRDNGIVYDPNDAYSRGEGFFHDIGAFNPEAPGMVAEIAKVLLAQEKKRRRGDLRYWEDTNNQLVVSSYTHGTGGADKFILTFEGDVWGVYSSLADAETARATYSANISDPSPLHITRSQQGAVRPGTGLRFVIRPASHQILWAAKGDVYSGTVRQGLSNEEILENYKVEKSSAGPVWSVLDTKGNVVAGPFESEMAATLAFANLGTGKYAETLSRSTHVDPKAPAASKLNLLSPSVADAITERRPENYNELGVRLALGNFYIEGEDLPKELRRLNEHLKRAFIAVHGSLDPIAPYQPKTVRRAAGEITASVAEPGYITAMAESLRRAQKKEGQLKLVLAARDIDISYLDAIGTEQAKARANSLRYDRGVTDTRLKSVHDDVVAMTRTLKSMRDAEKEYRSLSVPAKSDEQAVASALPEVNGAVQSMSSAAIGETYVQPSLGITASKAEDYQRNMLDLIAQAQKETDKYTDDGEFLGYIKRFYNKKFRKTVHSPESLAMRAPLFMASNPTARRDIAAFIKDAADRIMANGNLGSARVELVSALNYFFKERKAEGGLIDVAKMNSRRYGEFMTGIGLHQSGAIRALSELRDSLADVPPEDRADVDAAIQWADSVFFSALHLGRSAASALRPRVQVSDKDGKPVSIDNPLRREIEAVEAGRVDPPKGMDKAPAPTVDELSALDPDTGHPGLEDDFGITFVDTDAWYYGTVFPSFRGQDLRSVLFDKTLIALTPEAFAVSNRFEAYFGLDSEGSLRKLTRKKGMGHYLSEGGWEYDDEKAADIEYFGRRKIVRELADILAGNAFTDEELEMARWYGNTCYFAIGNGVSGSQQTAVDIRFDLPWGIENGKLAALISIEEAERRRGNATERPYAIHEALLRLKEVLPAPFVPHAVEAIKSAVLTANRAGKATKDVKAQLALKALRDAGFADTRERVKINPNGTQTTELYGAKFTVPVRLSEQLFKESSAAAKLEKNGRDREQFSIENAIAPIRETFDRLDRTVKSMGWSVNGDAKLFSDTGTHAPFFKGIGAFRHYSRRLEAPNTPEYKDAVQKAYDSLSESFKHMRKATRAGLVWLTGAEAAERTGFQRMFNFLKDLAPGTFTDADQAADVWAKIERGQAEHLGLNKDSRAWDIAVKVYELSVAKLHESAWSGGTVTTISPEMVGLEAFSRLVGDTAADLGETTTTPGVSFSDIYKNTGALALGLTAGEALATHAKQIAEMVRYRSCLNRALMTQGEDGRPLVYMRPSVNPNDDTIPDRVWGMVARWWVEVYAGPASKGAFYDEAATGRENATRLFDELVPLLKGAGATQEDARGLARYQLTDVEIPPGLSSVSGVAAMKDPAGDDTKARMNVFGGGEAANLMRQIFAVAGYGRPDTRLVGMNRFLSWSKSASVMASFFFPIATAFESPIAAVGTWPTLFGLTKTGADTARWIEKNGGWLAKVMGVNDVAKAPFMADILRVIGSDDPALVDLKTQAILSGLNLADRAHNMMDTDRTVIAKDIDKVTALVRKQINGKAAKTMRALLEGAMEHSSEVAFEYVINATKMAVFAQMNSRLRQKAMQAGRWWDPVRDMKKWANYINAEVGGIDPAMYPWMTPKMQQFLKAIMFSWEWTLGAWEAGGGNILTQKWFGQTTPGNIRGFMIGRWARMYGSVMIGLPLTMQVMINALAKAFGDGDPDDKWFTGQNEIGHGWKDFDITPLLRRIANAHVIPFVSSTPTFGDVKKMNIPIVSAMIPALTGQEGENVTTRRRRYYMHLGKQGWEIEGWFENPSKSFLSKMSMPAQRILEGVLGITPSMGWEMPFAEMGFWERWTSLDPEKSAALNLVNAVVPFSVMSMERAPEVGGISLFGPTSKGISKTRAINDMAAEFTRWADADTFAAQRQGVKGAWSDLKAMSVEWIDALRINGYDPKQSLKDALTKARRPLYDKIHKSLPVFPSDKADTKALEEAARGLYRLNYIAKDMMKSIRARDKAQHIKRTGDLSKITNEAMRDAFNNPYGPVGTTRDAAYGGDVRGLLATDDIPATMLGYKVVPQEQMTTAQRNYFGENPQAAGHFETAAKKGGI